MRVSVPGALARPCPRNNRSRRATLAVLVLVPVCKSASVMDQLRETRWTRWIRGGTNIDRPGAWPTGRVRQHLKRECGGLGGHPAGGTGSDSEEEAFETGNRGDISGTAINLVEAVKLPLATLARWKDERATFCGAVQVLLPQCLRHGRWWMTRRRGDSTRFRWGE